jgi:hypothetical protein
MVKYFLKASWQDKGKEVTKEQYMMAEENAGFHSKFEDKPATASFAGKGIEGWTEGESAIRDSKTEKVFKITRCLDCTDHVHGNSHFCIIKRHRVISDPNKLADWCPRKGWTIKWSD